MDGWMDGWMYRYNVDKFYAYQDAGMKVLHLKDSLWGCFAKRNPSLPERIAHPGEGKSWWRDRQIPPSGASISANRFSLSVSKMSPERSLTSVSVYLIQLIDFLQQTSYLSSVQIAVPV